MTTTLNDPYSNTTPIATAAQFKTALASVDISETEWALLEAQYKAQDHTLAAAQLAKKMGWSSHATANARYGALAHRIADGLNYHPGPWPGGGPCQHWWFTLSTWNPQAEDDDQWIMRPELVQALQALSRWTRCWNDMIERLHINGARMSIPETVMNEVIAMDLQNGCVYCHRKWDDWLTNPTKTNLPSWEHTGSYSCKSPESWNIMLCCHSCNCSQKPGIEAWIADKWPRTVQCNITLETVSPRVREYLRRMRQMGKDSA